MAFFFFTLAQVLFFLTVPFLFLGHYISEKV